MYITWLKADCSEVLFLCVNKHKDGTVRECSAVKLPEMSCAQPNVLVHGSPTFLVGHTWKRKECYT